MSTNTVNNKRIAKNTLFLYVRMLIILIISLYTSRIVLNTLGVKDYGIYNIVGGIVVLFSFLNGSLASATQRFLNFEMGRNDFERVKNVFSASLHAHILIAVVILILCESIGLWIVSTQLNIPVERRDAALWTYHLSIITFFISIIRIPFNASIIASEKMNFYAYISIIEAMAKLGIVYLLLSTSVDKLILYAILQTSVCLLITLAYINYCIRNFKYISFSFKFDKSLLKGILSFSGWSCYGNLSNIAASQGLNIILNLFFGVAVNAAMGIANQVSSTVYGFVANFQTAFNPQLIKLYSSDKKEEMRLLIYRASRISFFLLLLIALPLLFNTEPVLYIWLNQAPEYTVIFCQLILIDQFFYALSGPLWISAQASGKIAKYMIAVGNFNITTLIISYVLLKLGCPAVSVLLCKIFIDFVVYGYRIMYLKKYIDLDIRDYTCNTILPIVKVTLISVLTPYLLNNLIEFSLLNLLIKIVITVIVTSLIILFVGLTRNERNYILKNLKNRLHINKHL